MTTYKTRMKSIWKHYVPLAGYLPILFMILYQDSPILWKWISFGLLLFALCCFLMAYSAGNNVVYAFSENSLFIKQGPIFRWKIKYAKIQYVYEVKVLENEENYYPDGRFVIEYRRGKKETFVCPQNNYEFLIQINNKIRY